MARWGHTDDQGCENDPGHVGSRGHSLGHDPYVRPYEASNRGCCDEVKENVHDEESEHQYHQHHDVHDHDQTQTARRQKEEHSSIFREQNHLTYLNFEDIITTDALVVHLVVGIISITSVLVFNESEPVIRQLNRMQSEYLTLTDGWT
ncbi:hypothetical protein HG530_006229 [Fusarium avenaceum]|nr:hypothetical protein HG530_006229 [Fusarium avenaceum]